MLTAEKRGGSGKCGCMASSDGTGHAARVTAVKPAHETLVTLMQSFEHQRVQDIVHSRRSPS